MTSKIVVNNIEADAGISTVAFGSKVSATEFIGPVTGNVTGDVSGNVTGNLTGTASTATAAATAYGLSGSPTLSIGAGSTASPSLSPTGDSNTGIFFPSADTIAFAEGGAEAARIDSSGRLLVGTATSPSAGVGQYAISVVQGQAGSSTGEGILSLARGTVATSITNGQTLGQIVFTDNAGNTFAKVGAIANGTVSSTSDLPGALVFSTTPDGTSSPLERMRINEYGTFKASNTVIPTYLGSTLTYHEIRTDDNNQWIAVLSHATGGNPYGLNIYYQYANPTNTVSQFIHCNDNVALRFQVRSNGGVANYQSNDANLCDEREKKNIVNLDSTWDCLKHWELKKFHYNEDADDADLRYGVIAQQVAPHCPEVITDWVKQKAEDAVLDDDGNEVEPAKEEIVRMGVKEQQMMWMAIKALQEAQTRIETLETANASQAATIAALDARLTALEGN